MTTTKKTFAVFAVMLAAGCSTSMTVGGNDAAGTDAGPLGNDAGSGTDTGTRVDDAGSAAGTITGTVGGTMFNTAATALVIGAPDSAATTVVYVFSNPVRCSDLGAPGWDRVIPNATSVLEMKMFGLTPATFTVVTTLTPAPGEATVNHTLSSMTAVPVEMASRSGTVTLSTITAMGPATGSFDLTFAGTDHLSGRFNAVFCPGGVEP